VGAVKLKRLFVRKLPPVVGRSHSIAPLDTGETSLGKEVEGHKPSQPDLSGVRLLRDGKDAFAARALLARAAERTLDVQYYIWHDDLSGSLMLDEIEAAADRGVRVRLLLDDNGIPRMDKRLSSLDLHPNIEVRLFNPFVIRWPKFINWLFDFRRLNRRMHSKSFTVDNQVTILGGRNIGDEYFGARKDGLFADLDVLAVGPVVPQVSQAFDRCWNCDEAYPADHVFSRISAEARENLKRRATAIARSSEAESYREAIRALPLFGEMVDGRVALVWAAVRLVGNHSAAFPQHAPGLTGVEELLPAGLERPEGEMNLISGYFVPTRTAADDLAALAENGIRIRVLTNSYEANDVGLVHAGYAPHRKRLLTAGVELFEMPAPDDKPKTVRKFVRRRSARALAAIEPGRTLHAKAFGIDGDRLYVGSANFDPRSAHLNEELGVIIESSDLAGQLSRLFDDEIACNSYRLGLDGRGGLQWTDERDDRPEPENIEPGTSLFSRTLIRLLSRLSIDHLL